MIKTNIWTTGKSDIGPTLY